MAETKVSRLPPYVPYRTFQTYLSSLEQAVPTRIDKSVLSQLGGSIQQQLLGTLRYLRLIDEEDGTPTENLTYLVSARGRARQEVMHKIILNAYQPVIAGLELRAATPLQIDEQLRKAGARGDTLRKCRAFFLSAAEDAGVQLAFAGRTSQRRLRSSTNLRSSEQAPQDSPGARWADLVLSKFPTLDPSWPADVKVKWFEDFERLLKIESVGGGDRPPAAAGPEAAGSY